jgi:hypothetical protein
MKREWEGPGNLDGNHPGDRYAHRRARGAIAVPEREDG